MPLPAGFKVNGSKTASSSVFPIPPRAKKIMTMLDKLPVSEVLTTLEMTLRAGMSPSASGGLTTHPAILEYREKVDNKVFWGSKKTIAELRRKLNEPEDNQ